MGSGQFNWAKGFWGKGLVLLLLFCPLFGGLAVVTVIVSGIGMHLLPVDQGCSAFDGELPGFGRLQNIGERLVLGHAAIDGGHTAGLGRFLHRVEAWKIRRGELVDLFGVLDHELDLEKVPAADLLAADHGRKLHLPRGEEAGKQGDRQ